MLRLAASRLTTISRNTAAVRAIPQVALTARRWGSELAESEFDAKWEAYFKREDIDGWELRHGMNRLYGEDLVPEPKIIQAALQACRRLNDLAMAVRILEMIRDKSCGDKEIYNYILQECKPVIEELGISTPEELGL